MQIVVAEDGERFVEDWTNKFPDKTAERREVTVHYGGVPVVSFTFIYVDGFRHLIPLPQRGDPMKIDKLQYAIGKIIDGPRRSLDDGLQRAGIEVVEAHERSMSW